MHSTMATCMVGTGPIQYGWDIAVCRLRPSSWSMASVGTGGLAGPSVATGPDARPGWSDRSWPSRRCSPGSTTCNVTVEIVMHPVGPLDPKVYWLRRVVVIGVAVLLLVGLVWFVVAKARSSAASGPETAADNTMIGNGTCRK